MADEKPVWRQPYRKPPWIESKDSLSTEKLLEPREREHPRKDSNREFQPDPVKSRGPPEMNPSAPHLTGRTGLSSPGGHDIHAGQKPFVPAPSELLPQNKLDRRRVLATPEEGGE